MAIVTKPATISRGVPANFTLDKGALAALPQIDADDYFRDVGNWKEVRLIYTTPMGGKEEVIFDASPLFPVAPFDLAPRGRSGVYDFDSIYIEDFDNGYLIVKKQEIVPQAEFEVEIAPQAELTLAEWIYLSHIFSLSEDFYGA